MSVPRVRSKRANAIKRSRSLGLNPQSRPEVVGTRLVRPPDRLHDYIEQVIAAAPPLSAEVRSRISGLLRGEHRG